MAEILIPFVNALVIHDAEGDRLFAKYYDGRNKAQQKDFEATLHKKTKNMPAKSEAEVLLLEPEVIVFKSGSDCRFYIVGPGEENELVLLSVLDAVYDSVYALMKGQVDKRTMLDNLELILLTIDEIMDNGHIMELDSTSVVSRVLMKGHDHGASEGRSGNSGSSSQPQSMGDISLAQALGLATNSFFKGFTGGRSSSEY